jgi:hypothetical protein
MAAVHRYRTSVHAKAMTAIDRPADIRNGLLGIKRGLAEYFYQIAADQACYTLGLLHADE